MTTNKKLETLKKSMTERQVLELKDINGIVAILVFLSMVLSKILEFLFIRIENT